MSPPAPTKTNPGPPWSKAFDWIESHLGGRIRHFERQPRWRPAFYIDLERDGESLPLYVRGARTEVEDGAKTLEFEMRVLQQLEADGVPVPHIYGFCPDPAGIVMDRSPGRENLATADSETERRMNCSIDEESRGLLSFTSGPSDSSRKPSGESNRQTTATDGRVSRRVNAWNALFNSGESSSINHAGSTIRLTEPSCRSWGWLMSR